MSYRPAVATKCLVEPPPAVLVAPDILRLAVEELETVTDPGLSKRAEAAFKVGQAQKAYALVRAIDWTAFHWFWTEGGNEWLRRHDKTSHVPFVGPKATAIGVKVKHAVAQRDRWTCRYCGLRVVTSATMAALERRLPAALPMSAIGPSSMTCHPMQCVLRLTWDHIEPHSRGGDSTEDNVVATCGTCNFMKGDCSLGELSLQGPLHGPDVTSDWRGLDGRLGARPL